MQRSSVSPALVSGLGAQAALTRSALEGNNNNNNQLRVPGMGAVPSTVTTTLGHGDGLDGGPMCGLVGGPRFPRPSSCSDSCKY